MRKAGVLGRTSLNRLDEQVWCVGHKNFLQFGPDSLDRIDHIFLAAAKCPFSDASQWLCIYAFFCIDINFKWTKRSMWATLTTSGLEPTASTTYRIEF